MRRLPIASFLFIAALAAQAPAFAQGLSANDEANARFQTGLKYYDARDFESARLAFTQAYAVLQKPSILLNLALSELYSNHPVEAIAHLEQYMNDPSTPADKREKAKKPLDEAMKKTGHLEIRTAPQAQVRLDGKPIAVTASPVHVMPGAHALEAKLGAKTKTANVEAKAGETTAVDLAFEQEPAPGPATPPPSSTAASPAPPPGTDPGPTEPPPTSPTRESFWGLRSIGGLALAGVGAVALGAGVVFKGSEASDRDRANELAAGLPPSGCTGSTTAQCRDLADAVQSRDDAAQNASTMFVVGGVTLGVGAVLVASALVWPHRRETTARIVPLAGPKQAGLLFSTNF
jgi:hypothetical protein